MDNNNKHNNDEKTALKAADLLDDVPLTSDMEEDSVVFETALGVAMTDVTPSIPRPRKTVFGIDPEDLHGNPSPPPRYTPNKDTVLYTRSQLRAVNIITILLGVVCVLMSIAPLQLYNAGFIEPRQCDAIKKGWTISCRADVMAGVILAINGALNLISFALIKREVLWKCLGDGSASIVPWFSTALLTCGVTYSAVHFSGERSMFGIIAAAMATTLASLVPVISHGSPFKTLKLIPPFLVYGWISCIAMINTLITSTGAMGNPEETRKHLAYLLGGVAFPMASLGIPFIIYLSDITTRRHGKKNPAITELWYLGAQFGILGAMYSQLIVQ